MLMLSSEGVKMKTGILALGRRRLERLVILVDVRVFALQVCAIHYDLWFYSFAGPPRCTSLDFYKEYSSSVLRR